MSLDLSMNTTRPLGVAAPAPAVTVAVKVTGAPVAEGLAELISPVVVGTDAWTSAGRVIVSLSSVTAALRASARPSRVTPVVTVIEASARTFPRRME